MCAIVKGAQDTAVIADGWCNKVFIYYVHLYLWERWEPYYLSPHMMFTADYSKIHPKAKSYTMLFHVALFPWCIVAICLYVVLKIDIPFYNYSTSWYQFDFNSITSIIKQFIRSKYHPNVWQNMICWCILAL